MPCSDSEILVGARPSPLSVAQFKEVEAALKKFHPNITLQMVPIDTVGDRDMSTSLRTLDKTDFFTKDIDQALLQGACRIAIHSAKDLPEPLHDKLEIIALTEGVDSSDSLVLRAGETLDSLPKGAVIATSSERREEAVRALRSDLTFRDVRGTIHQRLRLLETGEADGIVVAEAALIRLDLLHLNRVKVPGSTTPLQGRLAIVSLKHDAEMASLFTCLDARPTVSRLYVGLTPPKFEPGVKAVHLPLITTVPLSVNMSTLYPQLKAATHIIFTSKQAVHYFFTLKGLPDLSHVIFFSVGQATAEMLKNKGYTSIIPEEATAEGICTLLENLGPDAFVVWPHAAGARSVITDYLMSRRLPHFAFNLYETKTVFPKELPCLSHFDEVFFSSPSCIQAFKKNYATLPPHLKAICIGSITEASLNL